jgi:hypothetical protein
VRRVVPVDGTQQATELSPSDVIAFTGYCFESGSIEDRNNAFGVPYETGTLERPRCNSNSGTLRAEHHRQVLMC